MSENKRQRWVNIYIVARSIYRNSTSSVRSLKYFLKTFYSLLKLPDLMSSGHAFCVLHTEYEIILCKRKEWSALSNALHKSKNTALETAI